jgi:hypothetical protein
MLFSFTLTALPLIASVLPLITQKPILLPAKLDIPSFAETTQMEPLVVVEPKREPRLVCKSCNTNEQRTLAFFQDKGITDKYALATIFGNIRQESTFVPNICEGGARTHYNGCHRGGYGLIQWTSTGRYNGLGTHSNRLGMSPSTLEAQLKYLVTEPQWKRIEHRMKTPGLSINQYMNAAYSWIGWGHHGYRTHYAYDYAKKFTWDS